MNKLLPYIVLVVVLAGAYYYRGAIKSYLPGNSPAEPTKATEAPSMSPATESGSKTITSETKSFTVSGTDFAFSPSTISVRTGDSVSVTFKNEGKFPHNFSVTELGVSGKTIQPGATDTVTFTADKAGTYKYLCTVGNHADKGMVGTITVE